jgi:hypothetical protein
MSKTLVLFDVDNIKGYVFATGRLKEMRGASLLVEENTEIAAIRALLKDPVFAGAEIIYADGAAGKVRFPDADTARKFCEKLEREYRDKTRTGSVTTACVEYGANFSETVRRGERCLRQNKADRREALEVVGGGPVRVCDWCGVYPAGEEYHPAPAARNQWLCATCHTKRREAEREKRRAAKYGALTGRDAFDRVFLQSFRGKESYDDWLAARRVGDLSELGQLAHPKGYLGFVYCDANQVSRHWEELEGDEKTYRRFSRALSAAVIGATAQALAACFSRPRDTYVPFEIVLMGGDDLALIIPADGALEVALRYCREFERLTAENRACPRRVAASAGVVIAHAAQPVLYLEKRAGELLQSAKKAAGRENGAVDFHIVTTPTLNPLAQIRREEYERGFTRLTRRPYLLDDFAALLDWAQQFKSELPATGGEATDPERRRFPRNKLSALYQALFRSPTQASYETAQMLMRLSGAHRGLVTGFADRFECNKPPPFSPEEGGVKNTAFTDLVEILEFIGGTA